MLLPQASVSAFPTPEAVGVRLLVPSTELSQHLTKHGFKNSGYFYWAVAMWRKGHGGEESIPAFPVSLDSQ